MSQSRTKRVLRAAAQVGVFVVAAMAAGLLTTGTASASYASQIAALQAQRSGLLSQLQSVQGQASSAGQQAAATQTQITAIQQKLAQGQTELSQVTAALAATSNQLAATQAQMAKDRTQLAALVTVLYQRENGNSMAAAIANSSGISQFVDSTISLQTIRQQFDALTQQLIADANKLKALQAQQQAQKQQVAALVSSLQSQNNQLQAQENAYSAEQNDLTGQAAQIAAQVQQISNQIVVLQEESAASVGTGGGGEWGEIIGTCTPSASNACYAGGYLNDDSYTPVGQCTWFVATHAYIPWHANADGWIADDDIYPIGSIPRVNSIVVFDPGGLYSGLGHVAWVVAVNGAEFTVEEDNVIGGGTEDMRIVPNADGTEGFIYPS
ncbi:MAG: CHAP domain-containing protein [Candidatus Dormiibacterota bacterium]